MTDKRSFPVPTQTEIDLFCEAARTAKGSRLYLGSLDGGGLDPFTDRFSIVSTFVDKYGAEIVNAKGMYGDTALTLASAVGNYDVVELLLEKGATLDAKGMGGQTALFWAKEYSRTDVIALLESWPDVQKQRREAALMNSHLQSLKRMRPAKPALKKGFPK